MNFDPHTATKHTHLTSVTLSFLLFFLRGWWVIHGSDRVQQVWVRVVPHIVDTVLLLTGILLLVLTNQSPWGASWVGVKLLAVLVYIGLGLLAFRFARTRSGRVAAWVTALLVFGYIVTVALTRSPTLHLFT